MSIECTYSSNEFNPQQQQLLEKEEEEEYIDMEITSFYTAFLHHHHQSKDFEFSLHSSGPLEPRHIPATSPADELFSNGKLLPLHPRPYNPNYDQSSFSTPLATTPISGTTPFESCNVSPAESCHVSRELTPADYNLFNAQEATTNHTKRSNWAKKLKLIKRPSLLSSKIKASKSYFKSLFGAKSNSPDHNPGDEDEDEEKTVISHRKSFSGAFRPIKAKTVSSESSSSSALKRSNSSRTSENESSVEGAIAHCKQSQSHRAIRSWKNFGAIRFEACQE